MKKLALLALSAALFAACGDDSSSSASDSKVVSCKVDASIDILGEHIESHRCFEMSSDKEEQLKAECEKGKSEITLLGGKASIAYSDGCETSKKTCSELGGTMYYYDADDLEMTCEQLADDDEDDDEE